MDKEKKPESRIKRKLRKKAIVSSVVFAVLAAASAVGGFALNKALSVRFDVDSESESQKCLFVGTWKEIEGEAVSLKVGLHPLARSPRFITLKGDDFNFNASGQQGNSSAWKDLKEWSQSVIGEGNRLDDFCKEGGRISFQSFCAGVTSDVFYADYGGGCYFVHNVEEDNEKPKVSFSAVNVYVPEDQIK